MKKLLLIIPFVIALGCASTPRKATYNTIDALTTAVSAAVDGYNYWAVRYKAANPVDGGKLLKLDGKVETALESYKAAATFTLLTLKTNDAPTTSLLLVASNLFTTIKGTNSL